MRKPMTARITQVTVVPEGEPIFSELATLICIEDEASGEYVAVRQTHRDGGVVAFGPEEWLTIRAEIDAMIERIRESDDDA